MRFIALRSGRVEQFFLDDVESHSNIRVERDTEFESFEAEKSQLDDDSAYPVTAHFKKDGAPLAIKCKYLVSCEGARSRTREQLGFQMVGAKSEKVFGVVDVQGITDFPDNRKLVLIRSKEAGLIMISREDRYNRIYVELDEIA